MTNEEWKIKRVNDVADLVKEWAISSEADMMWAIHNNNEPLQHYFKAKAEAFNMLSDWLKEIVND